MAYKQYKLTTPADRKIRNSFIPSRFLEASLCLLSSFLYLVSVCSLGIFLNGLIKILPAREHECFAPTKSTVLCTV